ncbi:MAG: methyltransferase domain-containing protein [Drouetiella hepatica Uher 2000/2452]|jgi:ubiquinone/menaquinone biosynthesis C-methylase UbiE|uniref:Methyltransferase domain-containing protein n=1 Tax=Drouetiella hepatica Uher 2000/2452 TaxID=904376 RepID=A0A951UN10_9CYAN|nr:methyltransferase domain-containing protein [Drouetiella hepatica Uher 2000/2452]
MANPFRAFLAHQLGFPSGWFGRLLLRVLNRNNAAINDLVLQSMQLQTGDRVLEIGFGGGYLIQRIVDTGMPALVAGVERSPEALAIARQRFRSQLSQGSIELSLSDAKALPFAEKNFNQLCTVNTLYFWSDPQHVLAECQRVLVSGGKLVIGYSSKEFLDQQKFSQHGFVAYEVTEVEAMLKIAGFIEIETFSGRSSRHQTFFCTSGTAH